MFTRTQPRLLKPSTQPSCTRRRSPRPGNIVLCLQPELAPKSVNNFVTLARNKFYDGLTFHRVVPDFVIQGGDPQGTGSGGPGYKVRRRTSPATVRRWRRRNGKFRTQHKWFSVLHRHRRRHRELQPLYNLFGKVQTGLDVAKQIQKGDVMTTVVVREQQ